MSRIAIVEALVLRDRDRQGPSLDGSWETVVVRLTDEDGVVGIGEADAPARAVQELVLMDDVHDWSRGLAGMLAGRDPFPVAALVAELYQATIYHGRRGLGIHALSAVDVALHDLAARQLGRPVFELLGGARRDALRPYATVYAGPVGERPLAEMVEALRSLALQAIELGFRGVKIEPLFEHLADDRALVSAIRDLHASLPAGIALLLDFGYRWHHWRDALWVLDHLADCDVELCEATLQHDDLDGHAKLATRVETRIGGAELAATVHECREWLERGRVDVLQPDAGRCGGLGELRRIADLAAQHGAAVIPHCWNTGITQAASRHFQAATPNAPWIEHFHPALYPSRLRAELVRPDPGPVDGLMLLPTGPGLGVELDPEALERFAVHG